MAHMMNVRQVADYLNIKERKVYDLVSRGKIPCSRVADIAGPLTNGAVSAVACETAHGGTTILWAVFTASLPRPSPAM